jgi:hypothetical protein
MTMAAMPSQGTSDAEDDDFDEKRFLVAIFFQGR